MNIKAGDNIVVGQSLGKLIKTAPESHVHIHVMKNEHLICYESMFSENEITDMMTKATTPLNKPRKLCYK